MGKIEKIKEKIIGGSADVAFNDVQTLLLHLGFSLRVKGSHHIFMKKGIPILINLQPTENGKAKHYQLRQLKKTINDYNL